MTLALVFAIGHWFFPGGSDGKKKKSACNAGDPSLIPGWGRSPGGEGMATRSSILAWKTPWTEDPGGLQFMGSQRVGYDGAANTTIGFYLVSSPS